MYPIPLVLEKVAQETKQKTDVDIFVEQVLSLESGNGIIQPIVSQLITNLKNRDGWNNLSFDQLWVISKGEHPWIGYPDAIGHTINRTKTNNKMMKDYLEIEQGLYGNIMNSPFRQSSLNRIILPALYDSARPLVFLKSISDIPSQDIRDYIKPFFGEAIIEARGSLTNGEWQDLLEHFKNTAETIEGQHAANLILTKIDVDSMLDRFPKEMDKYIFLKSVLGSSNHVGTTKVANKCKFYIDDILNNGLKLSKEQKETENSTSRCK